jgi:trans-2,3-dihydro-3-hydroxyanthranilate isomerase
LQGEDKLLALTFYLVDVFAEQKYSGNQLAVVTNAGKLTDSEMQKIANEMHFSETTFIRSDKQNNGGYNVRIFTPKLEVPFAGHPTLGTAYIIKQTLADKNTKEIILNLKVGQIPVTFGTRTDGKQTLWMKQLPAQFGKTYKKDFVTTLLGIDEPDIDSKYPIEEVSTGLPFIIIPLRNLKAIKKARINQNILPQIIEETRAGILIFSPQTYDKKNKLNVRVFVDVYGIPEDPATGSANGCLAAYLSKYEYFGEKNIDITVEQGFEINRPSIINLKTENNGNNIKVHVGGHVLLIAKGEII